ncbi:VCP-like ATPase [Cavenderia fasciculata]|uniref:VCP-like ATPase n=1 Tax=Cavenderia fasciculata TaxID=261658 RepID=F4PR12_CACFS|nr:VCP-like ATPase [Cavenderia fasciculata]EGG22069.1 VCP-like ATPase [Cavenderia fasciculata]|eukprot:XP_004359920.1 VCP-like ATPase [Cavenderia fasciculata]
MIKIKSLFKDSKDVSANLNDDICRISTLYINSNNNNNNDNDSATTIINIYQYVLIDLPLVGNNDKLLIQLHPLFNNNSNSDSSYNSILPSWILDNIIKQDQEKEQYLFNNNVLQLDLYPITPPPSSSSSSLSYSNALIIIEIDYIQDHSQSVYNIDRFNILDRDSSLSSIKRYLLDKPILNNVMIRLNIMGIPFLIKIEKILKQQQKGSNNYEEFNVNVKEPIYLNCESKMMIRLKTNTKEKEQENRGKQKKLLFDKVIHLEEEMKELNSILTIKFDVGRQHNKGGTTNLLTKTIRDSLRGVMVVGEQGTQTLELIQYVCNYPTTTVMDKPFKLVYIDSGFLEKSQNDRPTIDTSINTIFIFDGIDISFGRGESSSSSSQDRQSPLLLKLCSFIDSLLNNQMIICTSRSIENVNQLLLRASRIDRFIKISIPSQQQRFTILKSLIKNNYNDNEINNNNICQELSIQTPGFIYRDLYKLFSTTILTKLSSHNNNQNNNNLELMDFIKIISTITPSTMTHFDVLKINNNNNNNPWESVGGYSEIKQRLIEMIEWPLIHAKTFSNLSLQPSSGVILYGPSGCGKTLLVRAAAAKMNVNFISIKGSDIFSKWLGESERIIRDIFARARLSSPCILFFDEIDSICLSRSHMDAGEGGSNVQSRILSQLLNEMDGIQIKSQIFFMGCTTRLDLVDAALLRPGRFEAQLYVGLPTQDDRRDMIGRVIASRMAFDRDLDLDRLVELTDGYSGAGIQYLCNRAGLGALQLDIAEKFIKNVHFDKVLNNK